MKWPNVFVLTKSERRVVILIALILLAAAIVRHYRQPRLQPFQTRTPAPIESPTPQSEADQDTAPR